MEEKSRRDDIHMKKLCHNRGSFNQIICEEA